MIAQNQIRLYGGTFGIRDMTLLSSAAAMPEASFDGNKHTGLAAGLVFLELNNVSIEDPDGILYRTITDITEGKQNKETLSNVLNELSE